MSFYLCCSVLFDRLLKPDMGKKAKNKTQIKKKTLNPEFNEVSLQILPFSAHPDFTHSFVINFLLSLCYRSSVMKLSMVS